MFYSRGIFTVLQYSSQVTPKVFDSSASSTGGASATLGYHTARLTRYGRCPAVDMG